MTFRDFSAGGLINAAAKAVRLPMPFPQHSWRYNGRRIRPGEISALVAVEARWVTTVPLMVSPAVCGFPSPADDYLDRALDFNELLIENPAATFVVRIKGESMTGVGLFPNDFAVVNRARTAIDQSIVLALLDGEFTIKRYRRKGTRVWLQAENPAYGDIALDEDSDFEVWGVIAKSIRML